MSALFNAFVLVLALLAVPLQTQAAMSPSKPIVIAHRGASADRPEHTIAAYRLAIEQGADFIEPDLVITRDGVLVARHENEISETTDVAERPEFATRRTTKTIDGVAVTGWFTEDFTLAELRTLRTRERLPQLRPANRAFDGQDVIPTFDEIIVLAKAESARLGRPIGLYPETKHPSYFRSIGLPLEEPLFETLRRHGLDEPDAPVFIQSFEIGNLQTLRPLTGVRLIQLVAPVGGPADQPGQSYADMLTPEGLRAIRTYADGIGAEKSLIIPRGADGRLSAPTGLVEAAQAAGLLVHLWTFRPENYFLPADNRSSDNPAERGDAAGEIARYLATGINGFFTDSVPPGRLAVDARPLRGALPRP